MNAIQAHLDLVAEVTKRQPALQQSITRKELEDTLHNREIQFTIIEDSAPTFLIPSLHLMCSYNAHRWAWEAFQSDLGISSPLETVERLQAILERSAAIVAFRKLEARIKSIKLTEFP